MSKRTADDIEEDISLHMRGTYCSPKHVKIYCKKRIDNCRKELKRIKKRG